MSDDFVSVLFDPFVPDIFILKFAKLQWITSQRGYS